jgi:hypothetical protein
VTVRLLCADDGVSNFVKRQGDKENAHNLSDDSLDRGFPNVDARHCTMISIIPTGFRCSNANIQS